MLTQFFQTIRLILMLSPRSLTWGWGSGEAQARPAPPSPGQHSPPQHPHTLLHLGLAVQPSTNTVCRQGGTAQTPCLHHKCQIKQVSSQTDERDHTATIIILMMMTLQLQTNANFWEYAAECNESSVKKNLPLFLVSISEISQEKNFVNTFSLFLLLCPCKQHSRLSDC